MVRKKNTKRKATRKTVETIIHEEASRKNIPTAEFQSVMNKDDQNAISVAYERRNKDLDPQLVWRGKDVTDWSDLIVQTPPLFIQEKVHPKVLIDDLLKQTEESEPEPEEHQLGLFSDFNGLPDSDAKTEFYQHDANWTNRMILGDSLQVMSSLAEREGLRGQVQCIYVDPPYGIKFNSNFQWSTTNRDVADGKIGHITREPEQVKAFRDTWADGIHSYLTYLRDRLTIARDLLSESGSCFVQIGDENTHFLRSILDEVFGRENFVSMIVFTKTSGLGTQHKLVGRFDIILWYSKSSNFKFRELFQEQENPKQSGYTRLDPLRPDAGLYMSSDLTKPGPGQKYEVEMFGKSFHPGRRWWGYPKESLLRLNRAERLIGTKSSLRFKKFFSDYPLTAFTNIWTGLGGASNPQYVVETNEEVVQRCILMSTDPGDLVLDPTCGSGTTANVSEKWGRRWITIDTSRVALALARTRLMGAKYPYFLLSDSESGQSQLAKISSSSLNNTTTHNNIKAGFVYKRSPYITLKSIANNTEIDLIFDNFSDKLQSKLQELNEALSEDWEDWEVPENAEEKWPERVKVIYKEWKEIKTNLTQKVDESIAKNADFKLLVDQPYDDKNKVRVAGPFTVESISPHRMLAVDENDELIDPSKSKQRTDEGTDFAQVILENLKVAGVQQANKEDKIAFSSLTPWPGNFICAEGRYTEGDETTEKRAAIFIGPEFGTVARPDLVSAAKEAGDADFDVLIACAFSYDAHATEFNKLGRIPVLKARMNADLHMSEDLKNTGKGNLFVIFGEPDIELLDTDDNKVQVKIHGVDVFDPSTGEVRSDSADGIACWFVDTDYNEESFFVRHAYFLGANDPYKSLKTTLKAEINQEAWESLYGDTSRPFSKPQSGRIAVKVINHLGDEVMKVFRVE